MKLILKNSLDLSEADLARLSSHNIEVLEYNETGPNKGEILAGYIRHPFHELDEIEGLQFVQSMMVGYDGLDINRFKEKNVVFANGRGVSSIPIAEYVITRILMYYKRVDTLKEFANQKQWRNDYREMEELTDKNILVFGTGFIGKEIAKRLQAFGVKIYGVNSDGRDIEGFDQCYALKDCKEAIKAADVVVGCLPLNESTYQFYNRDFFELMKSQAVFINVGRGEQLHEEDLLSILDDHLGHVFLDVTPEEPLPSESPLWNHKKISITPHTSANSKNAEQRKKELVIENAIRFKEGEDVKCRVI